MPLGGIECVLQRVSQQCARHHHHYQRDAGRGRHPWRVDQGVPARRDHVSPGRRGRLHAEPQEREAGLEHDGVADAERRGDDHRGQRVRQDVAPQDSTARDAERERRFDERPGRKRARLAVDEAGHRHPARQPQHDDHEERARPPQRAQEEQEHHPRQGEGEVRDREQHGADRPAPVCRAGAYRHADHDGQQHGEAPHAE